MTVAHSTMYTTVTDDSSIVKIKMRVLYTNADQFLNKRDLLTQIAGSTPLDIVVISEILPKAPNAIVNLSLFTLPSVISILIPIVKTVPHLTYEK